MARFPRLKEADGTYPYLERVNPFGRKVDFDYTRYDYTATMKLCRVPWTADYRHVVNWADAQARDDWFSELDGYTIELPDGFVYAQLDSVNVEVPFDVCLAYNYIYMQVPELTPDDPIRHEGATSVRTICAFIAEPIYHAPSATELVLQLDAWTTYLPHLYVSGLMLDRGHAPMYATSATSYIRDPITHAANLLTPDVNFGAPTIVRDSEFEVCSTAAPIMVLASTIPYGSLNGIARAGSGSSSGPTFSDADSRYGHQLVVGGYEWATGTTYAGMTNPSSVTHTASNAAPGYYYYGIMGAAVASGALDTIAAALPVFVTACDGAYIVPSDLVNLGTVHTVNGVQVYEVGTEPTMQELASYRLDLEAFGYPERYADIAKLYTFPYAVLEVSDDAGTSLEIRVEDTHGYLVSYQRLSAAFPFLSWQAMVVNVSSVAEGATYTWTNLNGSTTQRSLPGADFAAYTIDLGIPTYALHLDARTSAAMRSYTDAQQQREQAIAGYQSTMRSANTGRENTVDSNYVARTNAYASADNSVTNTANSGQNSQANATVANNLRTASTARNNTAQAALNSDAVQNIYDSSNADLEYTEFATDVNLKSEAVSSIQNMIGNAIGGNPMGVINAGVSGIVNITTSNALSLLSLQNVLDHQGISQSHANTASSIHVANAADQASLSNSANTQTTNNNVSTANTNAVNSANTAKNNAIRSEAYGNGNANWSRAATEANAKQALTVAQNGYIRRTNQASILPPETHGSSSGDATPDIYQARGLHVRVLTQQDSAIARAGDTFLRYGYQFGGWWDVASWCPSGHEFCYWQSSDVWANELAFDNPQAARAFESILATGVTVWNDPTDIGGVL